VTASATAVVSCDSETAESLGGVTNSGTAPRPPVHLIGEEPVPVVPRISQQLADEMWVRLRSVMGGERFERFVVDFERSR
jgi:hypothetical protein